MVVVGTIKGNGSGVIKPVTRFKPAHNFIICGARSLFTKDVNTILPGYFVVFGSQQAMRCENFIPSFFFTLPSIFFSFSNNSLPYYLTRSCQILEMSLTTKECALAALLLVLDQVIVRNEFGHHLYIQKQFCYQILILISHKLIFSGRTSSGFCFRKPPLHFHHHPVPTY